jgi:replicative DNA helicase
MQPRERNFYLGQTVGQVIDRANEKALRGDLDDYVPIPTGLKVLDNAIGGGLRKTELVLLGGAQGVGKTIAALQMARNIAARTNQYAYYLSFEHTEVHLMHRLLCLESSQTQQPEGADSVNLKYLYNLIRSPEARPILQGRSSGGFQDLLLRDPKTAQAFMNVQEYAQKLILVKAHVKTCSTTNIREYIKDIRDRTNGNVTVFIDYLQKVSVLDEPYENDAEKVTIIVETIKDIAMSLEVPIVAVVSADREGLKSRRIHLYHFRGSSALDYECDIAVIMSNKYNIVDKDNQLSAGIDPAVFRKWVVFTVEKNRAGRAFLDVEYEIDAAHFRLNIDSGRYVRDRLFDDRIAET